MHMSKMKHEGHHFIKEVIEKLDLSIEQKKELEKLKKEMKKEKLKFAIKFIVNKANYESIGTLFISKIEKAENILNEDQKEKLRNIVIEKHKEVFIKHIIEMKYKLKEIVEKLDLATEQKESFEAVLTDAISEDGIEKLITLKDDISNILTNDQKEKAHNYFKNIIHFDEICSDLEISSEQKEKLHKLHDELHSSKLDTLRKFQNGEISFSEVAKLKFNIFNEFKSTFTEEQIKKLKKMHGDHCHGHHEHGFNHHKHEHCKTY